MRQEGDDVFPCRKMAFNIIVNNLVAYYLVASSESEYQVQIRIGLLCR